MNMISRVGHPRWANRSPLNPDSRSARGKSGCLGRYTAKEWRVTGSDKVRDRKQKLQEYIQRVVDDAPPLSEEQRAQLAVLLRGASGRPDNRSQGSPEDLWSNHHPESGRSGRRDSEGGVVPGGKTRRLVESYDHPVRGDEERVIQAFCAYLNDQGWTIEREIGFVDVVAQRGTHRILAEAKGRTAAIGLDVDTMFGQLLRRMPQERPAPDTRFAVVVPAEASVAVERVPEWVRRELGIDVYVVSNDGSVAKRG